MLPAPFVVVLDANVLFPFTLRDTLLRAAAAVKAGAQVVTTANLRDFELLPDGLEAQSPDEFLCNLFDLDPESFVALLHEQAGVLTNPPVSFEELLARLERSAPELVVAIRVHVGKATADPALPEDEG